MHKHTGTSPYMCFVFAALRWYALLPKHSKLPLLSEMKYLLQNSWGPKILEISVMIEIPYFVIP